MKTKLVIALVVVLFVVEWIILKQSTPATAAKDSPPVAQAPTPSSHAARSSLGSSKGNAMSRIARLMAGGEAPRLAAAQLDAYLSANKRNAESLLAAFSTTGEDVFLREAKEKFPRDPRVDMVAAMRSGSPEERRQWLDLLKQTAPDNALGNYLSANDYFKTGQTNLALQELTAATGKTSLDDYSREFMQSSEEAWRAAGYSATEAKYMALGELPLPQLAQYKQAAVSLGEVATAYRQAGDPASAQAALQMGLTFGQRLDDPTKQGSPEMIQELVGFAIERIMLGQLDPAAPYGNSEQTVQDRINALQQRRDSIRTLVGQSQSLLPALPDDDFTSYLDRRKISGEEQALRWVVNKYGPAQ